MNMNIADLNRVLSETKARLQAPVAEQSEPNQHNPKKLSGAQKRLQGLYKKLVNGRDASTEIASTGAKR